MTPRRNNVGLRQRQNFGVVWSSQNHFSLVFFSSLSVKQSLLLLLLFIYQHIIPLAGLPLPALAARVM